MDEQISESRKMSDELCEQVMKGEGCLFSMLVVMAVVPESAKWEILTQVRPKRVCGEIV
jgi:hypothetical protein